MDYMQKYGIHNVRGSGYCSIYLSSSDIAYIERRLMSRHDLCFICKGRGHFAADCIYNKDSPSSLIKRKSSNSTVDYDSPHSYSNPIPSPQKRHHSSHHVFHENSSNSKSNKSRSCQRCGNSSHTIDECFAIKDINGRYISKKEMNPNYNYYSKSFNESKGNACFRCGRDSHWISDCYSTRHINGDILFD